MLRSPSGVLLIAGLGFALSGCSAGAAAAPADAARNKMDPPCSVSIDGVMRSRALSCFRGCPVEMFEPGAAVYEFADVAAFSRGWSASHASPAMVGGMLRFGPHPLTGNRWDNDSPIRTSAAFGNAMVCARFRMSPQDDPVDPGGDAFQLSLRGEAEGMALTIEGARSDATLRSRTPAGDWRRHAVAKMSLPRGQQQVMEGLLYGSGDHFIAEVKDGITGEIAALSATAQVPQSGVVGIMGWRLHNALMLDRVVVGMPSSRVIDALTDPSR